MSEKLDKKRKQTEERADAAISEAVTTVHTEGEKQQAYMILGGLKVVNHIQTSLNAQMLRGMQMIRDTKAFEALGYTRFDDFLDNDEHSPMSYKSFNEREKLLMTEGDAAFDVLSQVGLSLRKRKLLGAGHVQIDKDKGRAIIVTLKDDEEIEEEIELTDRTRLLQTLSALADQNAIQNAKLNKQKETIKKGEAQVDKLQHELDDAKLRGGLMSMDNVHVEHFLRTTNCLKTMSEFVGKLPEDKREESADFFIAEIDAAYRNLLRAYGRTEPNPLIADDETRKAHIAKVLSKTNMDDSDEFASVFEKNEEELAKLLD